MKLYRKPELSKKKVIVLLTVIILLAIFCFYQNKHLTVSEYTFTTSKISTNENSLRIVQISDLHNAKFGKNNSRLISLITDHSPDIIVITGDIVDSNHTNIDTAVDLCTQAAKIAPCYYVTGNHEMWLTNSDKTKLFDGIKSAGVHILNDESITLNDDIVLTGLDDSSLYNGTLAALSHDIPEDKLHIVLAHEPQYLEEEYVLSSPDLIITGHAHGGQVRLPFIGGLVAPDQGFFPEYTSGEYNALSSSADGTELKTTMYVSRGLGNSVIPLRVFNYPEINVLNIQKEN